jgi:hypothetical protein
VLGIDIKIYYLVIAKNKSTRNEEHTCDCDDKFSSLGTDMISNQGFWILINSHYWWESETSTKAYGEE